MQSVAKNSLHELLLERTRRGELWKPEKDGVRCFACGHRCFIPEGRDGICKVRSNIKGELRVPWGYVGGIQLDPIEKKPFFHVLPGTKALSFGMLGCDYRCAYCQNWYTSQTLRDEEASALPQDISADEIALMAKRYGASVLTSTYNEPLITSEWAVEVFKKAKPYQVRGSYVSNGNATPEVLEYLRPYVDFYKIDLKAFNDKSYRQLGGVLQTVTESIQNAHRLGFWLEIVTLLIPGFNDDPREIRELCQFLKSVSADIPWHVTAYHQDYKMRDHDRTPASALLKAAQIGKEEGLNFIYLGNLPGNVGNWESTYCPKCNEEVIERKGFAVHKNSLVNGRCPKCNTAVAGVWE